MFFYLVFFLLFAGYTPHCNAKTYTYKFHPKLLISENAPLSDDVKVQGHPQALAQGARDFLDNNDFAIGEAVKPFYFANDITLTSLKETYQFIERIAREDEKKNRQRLCDPQFLNKNFTFFRLNPDLELQRASVARTDWHKHLVPGQAKLTCYAAFVVPGSPVKTAQYTHALYQLKEGPSSNHHQVRTRYSKTEILQGALDHPDHTYSIKPLAWVTETGFKDALMQGTVFVEFPDKNIRSFGIHKHNGFTFDKQHVGKKAQEQYWFFRPLDNLTTRQRINKKIDGFSGTAVAGDLRNLGYGSVLLLSGINPQTKQPEVRLTLLVDTGGAFNDNVSHFDLFLGRYHSKKEFWAEKKAIPEHVSAYFMVKKKSPARKQGSSKKLV